MVELNETLQECLKKCSKEDLWEIITKVEHTEVYILDLQAFQFVYCNEIACKNLGYTLEEVQLMSPIELHPHNSSNELHEIANRVESLGSASFSTVSRKKDGTIYPVKVHLQYLVEGSMRFILGTMIDLTQQENFRAEQWKLISLLQDFSVHANVYDLVVTDFTMPELNGVELIRQMREFREDLPYLLISGYGSNMGDYDLEKEGVRRFLKKPEAIQHLPQVVREILN